MLLVKYDFNYADEFDVAGFELMTQEEFDYMLASARQVFIENSGTKWTDREYGWQNNWDDDEVSQGFGGNDAIVFEDYESYVEGLEVQYINKYTEHNLRKLFPEVKYGYGHTFWLEY